MTDAIDIGIRVKSTGDVRGFREVESASKEMRSEVERLTKTVQEQEREMRQLERRYDTLARETEGFRRGNDRAAASMGELKDLGVAAVTGIGAATTAFVVDSVNATNRYESQMREVFTLVPGITAAAMEDMKGDVRSFSNEVDRSTTEVVPALYQAISAGVPQENVFSFLEVANQTAVGGVTDLEVAVDGLSSVVNAYGSDVVSAQEASDLMFTAVRKGKTTVDELSRSLFNVIPTASSLELEFGNVTAALASMTSQGTPTSVATTQLRQLLVELSKAGTESAQTFERAAGVSFKEFIAQGNNLQDALIIMEQAAGELDVGINDLFGSVEAGNAALALTGSGAAGFTANLNEMENATGATAAAYETMAESGQRNIDNLVVAWGDLQLATGEYIASIEALPIAVERVASSVELLSGGAQRGVADLVEQQAAAGGDVESLRAEVERLDEALSQTDTTNSWWLSSINPLAGVAEAALNRLASNEVAAPIEERLQEIVLQAAEGVESAEELEEKLSGVFGDSLMTQQDVDGTIWYFAEVNGKMIELGVSADILADSQERAIEKMGTYTNAFGDLDSELTAIQANTSATADGFDMVADASDDLGAATINVLDNIDQERLAFEGAKIAAERHAAAMADNRAELERSAEAYKGYFLDSENLFADLYEAQADFAAAQGDWITTSTDNSYELGRVNEQLAADLSDEQAKAMRDILANNEEGSAEWLAAYTALQGDLTQAQRNALIAQQNDLETAHGEVVDAYTGNAVAAEEAAERIAAAQEAIRAELRKTAFEQTLAAASPEQIGEALQLGVDLGLITEEERQQREAFAATSLAIEQKTATLSEGAVINDDYRETMSLLTTGLIENLDQAEALAEHFSGDQVDAFVAAAEQGKDLEEILKELGIAMDNFDREITVQIRTDTSGFVLPEAGATVRGNESGGAVAFADGGLVTGGIAGQDSVPALLMPGEFVLRTQAASQIGLDALNQLNRSGQIGGGPISLRQEIHIHGVDTAAVSPTAEAVSNSTADLLRQIGVNPK